MTKRVMIQLPYSDGLKAVLEDRDDIEVELFTELGEDNIHQHIGNYQGHVTRWK